MSPVINAVGWALLHFVWQGALVALIFAVAVRLLRTPDARYALGVTAMLAMLALPVVTAVRHYSAPSRAMGPIASSDAVPVSTPVTPSVTRGASTGDDAGAAEAPAPVPGGALPRDAERIDFAGALESAVAPLGARLPIVVGLWLVGVFILSLRLFDAWLYAWRLTREGTSRAPEEHRRMLERLAGRLGLRRTVTMLESAFLQSPAVVGWLRPVVLLPAVALTGLTAQQVEALIAHELAHVKRHDFIANLLQSSIETLLFYHPAVWFVSRRVREIREHCCGDIAVRNSGDPEPYPRARPRRSSASHRRGRECRRSLRQQRADRCSSGFAGFSSRSTVPPRASRAGWQARPCSSPRFCSRARTGDSRLRARAARASRSRPSSPTRTRSAPTRCSMRRRVRSPPGGSGRAMRRAAAAIAPSGSGTSSSRSRRRRIARSTSAGWSEAASRDPASTSAAGS